MGWDITDPFLGEGEPKGRSRGPDAKVILGETKFTSFRHVVDRSVRRGAESVR